MAREYAAFISYRHRPLDIAVAIKVHKCIERFKIPGDLRREEKKNPGSVCKNWNGAPPEKLVVFRDRDELPLSNDLTSDIFEALDNAKCLIVICTPDTPKSLWVRREISHFIEKHGRKRIITVLAAGTPEESIPKEITTRYAEDGVTVLEEYEPLVAYLVDDNEKKVLKNLDKEKIRVCAAILGCPYDSLKQRHKRRRMQQALIASAAAFVLALSFIGMLVNRNLEIQAQKREVEAQKLEVEKQKRMVQLRESELLADDARAALESGNTRDAIEKAVAALPKAGEEDRPYYAPAEAVLMEAMDVMGGAEDHVLLSETVLEQMTPISHLDLSGDGSLAVTIDDYGVVHCFDTITGEEKWVEIVTMQDTAASTSYVRISADESCLVCQCGDALEGRDLQTGELLWSYEMRYAAEGYFIYDDIRNRIAVLRNYQKAGEGYLLELEVISAVTGAVQQNILLEQTEMNMYRFIHNTYQTRLPTGGVFSEDGRYFACAFARDHEEEGKSWLDCIVVDLQEGTVVTRYSQEMADGNLEVSRMTFLEDGLLVALEVGDNAVAGSLVKLDWQNGEVLWHTTTPAELKGTSYSGDLTSYVLFWENVAFLGRFEKLYAIDLQTGQILNSVLLPGTLTSLDTVSERYFGFALEEGIYAIGWYNTDYGFSLTTDQFYQVTTSVEAHKLLLPHGGGIVQMVLDDQYMEISVSNIDRPGYLAIVPKENEKQLIFQRPVAIEKTITPTPVTVPVEFSSLRCTDGSGVLLPDNTLVLGQFYGRDESWTYHYFHVLLDPVTHALKQVIPTEDSFSNRYFFLPDGSGSYLRMHKEGTTTLVQAGVETVLTERVDPHHEEDLQISVRGMVKTDSVYLTDGTVMTAHFDTKELTVLKNGAEVSRVEIPESHRYSQELGSGVQRFVKAGRNGYLVTHLTWLLESVSATDVAFCNTADGSWFLPELEAPLTNTDAYAFAGTAPYFAAVDGKHMVRVLDLQTGTEVAAFSLQLPCSSVLHMDFILEDTCLMVKTRDADVLIYDIATGEILLQDKLKTTFSGKLTAWEDPDSRRLYIVDNSQDGTNTLCIDLQSWTVLARAEDILCYVPETHELYHMDDAYSSTEPRFFYFRIPDTDTLVQLGQKMLDAQ